MPAISSGVKSRLMKFGGMEGNIAEPSTSEWANPNICPISCRASVSTSKEFEAAPMLQVCSLSSK